MTDKQIFQVLIIEDDEDDYKIIKESLSEIHHVDFSLDWNTGVEMAREKIMDHKYDICLMDYRLGEMNGLELMKELIDNGFNAPFIILTGYGDRDIDLEAMKAGAADYLEKDKIYPGILERSIRYAIERKKNMDALCVSEQRLRFLSEKLVEAQESERKRVAKEIHDGIGSNLVAIKYGLESIMAHEGKNSSPGKGPEMDQIITYIRETIEEAQRISSNLRPSVLDDMGLGASVRWICRRYLDIYPDIRINKIVEPEEMDVAQTLKVVVFRVLQEAMNNVVKHSGADTISLTVKKSHDRLTLEIRDNGQGFDISKHSNGTSVNGMGLMGMKERVDLSGGSLSINSGKGKGCVVLAIWPLKGLL